jgi:hypothetical protein
MFIQKTALRLLKLHVAVSEIPKIVIGKSNDFSGATLLRFRSPHTAFSTICAGMLAVNLAN